MSIINQSRRYVLAVADFFVVAFCSFAMQILIPFLIHGFGADYSAIIRNNLHITAILAASSCLGLVLCRNYAIVWRYATMRDLIRCIGGIAFGVILTAVAIILFFPSTNSLHISWPNIYTLGGTWLIASLALCLGRILYIIYSQARSSVDSRKMAKNRRRAMIIGAGYSCKVLLNELQAEDSEVEAVCIIDDDPNKISRSFRGVRIYGPMLLIPSLAEKFNIDEIIFAIPSCPDERRKEILKICSGTKCDVRVLPKLGDIVLDHKMLHQVTTIDTRQLLERGSVELGGDTVSDFIRDKVCMVTGGGGSIGSELCRQIVAAKPKQLVIVDIYENTTYELQQEILMNTDFRNLVVEIASVRDYSRMDAVIGKYRPNVIFHAAAHKHVPLMEDSPEEAVKNNIFGTFNVATLADFYKVEKMVLISTDKAVNPTNVMGATKRCCEMVMQYMAQQESVTKFSAVRFGNVLGSNGSVIPLFRKQIEAGGPVTVTHPDIIRYFMTISEAVSLVLTAGAIAEGGEIYVLDMGSPVKITTLAENLIRMYGYEPYTEMPIKFTGLRPGEKMFEELLMSEEGLKATENNKIFIGNQIKIEPEEFIDKLSKLKFCAINCGEDKSDLLASLSDMVPTFNHQGH